MKLLQKIVLLFNFKPFTYLFQAIYALGLKTLVAVLARHPAVRSIFGYGSFFEGRCLYGVSDIDIVILISENFSRTDAVHHEIALAYNRVRRFFPFLAHWHEGAANLIFLSDLRAGFPVPEPLRLRLKQRRLVLLYGVSFPEEFVMGHVSTNETVSEIDTLLRIVLMKGEVYTSNQLFWKKLFLKLIALADTFGLHELAEDIRAHEDMRFLKGNDVLLFIRKSDSNNLFRLMLEFSRRIFKEVQKSEETITLSYTALDGGPWNGSSENYIKQNFNGSKALTTIFRAANVNLKILQSSLCGIMPRLNYLPMDKPVPVLEIEKASYDGLRSAAMTLTNYGKSSESFLVQVDDFLFLMHRLPTYTDIVPLDPLIFANIYARLFRDEESFDMPVSIYEEQKMEANRMFMALAELYRKNEGWVTKLQFPVIYSEDDLPVIRDAFHRMRVFIAHFDGVDIGSTGSLVDFLSRKHPTCGAFLNDLLDYYRHLIGENGQKTTANNLYRCLLQFMAQMLSGASSILIDNHRKRLGITVGIITRNRATDLQDVLESLIHQIRPADEVLIVDNGSTDNTRYVVESFRERLPISYDFVEEASIPNARNVVIENARHEIVSFTDDDCITEPEWLDAVERGFLRAENIGIVGGWVRHESAAEESMLETYYSLFHHNRP